MWFNSQFLQELQETNEEATIYNCLAYNVHFKEHIQDLIVLNVTKENYKILIELCDFLMIDNVDKFIDKIVKIHDYDYNIIYEFEDFYKYNTKRLIPLDRDILENAIELYCKDHKLCFHIYGFSSFWDVSDVFYMDFLFCENTFNGDISNWNVSNVKMMDCMFFRSKFNQDISNWDVSNVVSMNCMFDESQFNQDISNWNVSNVKYMGNMFKESQFNQDISKWNVSNVRFMGFMFKESQFNQDISKWNVSNVEDMDHMFEGSPFNQDISNWDITNVKFIDHMFEGISFKDLL